MPSSATSCNLGMNLCDFVIKNDVVVRSRVPHMKRTGRPGLRLAGRSKKAISVCESKATGDSYTLFFVVTSLVGTSIVEWSFHALRELAEIERPFLFKGK